MNRRGLAASGAAAVALLALAAIASHGRPLSGGSGQGPSATFFDYVATSLVIVCMLLLAILVYAVLTERGGGLPKRRGPFYLLNSLAMLAGAALLSFFILHSHFEQRLRRAAADAAKRQQSGQLERGAKGANARNARIRWDEIAVVVALLGGTAIVLVARRRTRRMPRLLGPGRKSAVTRALDESIDDLLADGDLRRAIVAAYARMEHALAAAGVGRHPAEAPFEYMARALRNLDASAASAERLTELFEWAEFSHHEPGPEMRDDAVEALVAVRDELRSREAETVPR